MKLEKAAGDRRPSGASVPSLWSQVYTVSLTDLTPLNSLEWQKYWPYSYSVVRAGTYKERDCCTARDQVYHNGYGLVCAFCRKAWIETDRL